MLMKKILCGTKAVKDSLKEKSLNVKNNYEEHMRLYEDRMKNLKEDFKTFIQYVLTVNANYIEIARENNSTVILTFTENDMDKYLVDELGEYDLERIRTVFHINPSIAQELGFKGIVIKIEPEYYQLVLRCFE